MAPSSCYLQLSNTSCPQLPKQNWLHSTMVANLPSPFAQLLKKWDIHSSNAPWSPPTTSLPKASPCAPWLLKHQNQWINASIGSNATCTTPIPLLVASRHRQSRQLYQQVSSSKPSPNSPSILHPGHSTTTKNYFSLSILIHSLCFHTSWSLDPSLWNFLVTSQACTCKGVLLSLLSNQDTQVIQAQSYLLLDYWKPWSNL